MKKGETLQLLHQITLLHRVLLDQIKVEINTDQLGVLWSPENKTVCKLKNIIWFKVSTETVA